MAIAEADLVAATAQVHGFVGQARANRFNLEYAIEQVNDQDRQSAGERGDAQQSQGGAGTGARSNLRRAEQLAPSGAISKEDLDVRRQTVKVDEATVEEALQAIYANRASLGLPPEPPPGQDLSAGAAGPGPELFDRPPGAGPVDRERGPVRLLPNQLGRDAEPDGGQLLQAGSAGRPESNLRAA